MSLYELCKEMFLCLMNCVYLVDYFEERMLIKKQSGTYQELIHVKF